MGDGEHHLVTPSLGVAQPPLVTPPSTDAEPNVVTPPAGLGKDEGKDDPASSKKDEDGVDLPEAIPVGNPIKDENGRKYYKGFEYDGTEFKPLDTVTLNPDEGSPDVPYVALIKVILCLSTVISTAASSSYCNLHENATRPLYVLCSLLWEWGSLKELLV